MSLRQRKGGKSSSSPSSSSKYEGMDQSLTELPVVDELNGTPTMEITPIPTAERTHETPKRKNLSSLTSSSSDSLLQESPTPTKNEPRRAMTGAQVAKDESRTRKIIVRAVSGVGMIGVFTTCVYMGHLYVCMIVALCEFLLFRELVKVRYNAHFHTIQDTIPLFRTTQWMWFVTAIFYTYQDFIVEVIQNNSQLHYLGFYARYMSTLAFILYSATFVLTIATMQVGI